MSRVHHSSASAVEPAADDPAVIAAAWVERLTAGRTDETDLAELRAWLAEDPAHRRAYERARAVWLELPETSLRGHRRAPLRVIGAGALAACLVAALTLFPGFHDHATSAGEVRSLALPDGSTLWLDSDSAIDLAFDDSRRTIVLERGRIAVDVAAGDMRPLTIEAGEASVTDIGTVFSVDRAGGLSVAVEEGIVDVALAGRVTRLEAGEAGNFDGSRRAMRAARTGEFAWRDGRIVLDAVPLAQALAELDRHFAGRIVLVDGALAGQRVSGTLFAGRAEEGLEALARSQGLSVTRLPWLILVGAGD